MALYGILFKADECFQRALCAPTYADPGIKYETQVTWQKQRDTHATQPTTLPLRHPDI